GLRSLLDAPLNYAVPLLSVALALLYVAGTVVERHRAQRREAISVGAKDGWLAGIIVLWLVLLTHSQDFLWLEFPLVFLTLHILALVPALVTVAGLWVAAAFVPLWLHPESWALAAAIGPLIGTALAVAIYFAYRALHAEVQRSEERRVGEEGM